MFFQLAIIHRLQLLPYLTDADVVHMLQASRTIAEHVVTNFTFHRVFVIHSLPNLHSLVSFCCQWKLNITCLHLMIDFKPGETLLDDAGQEEVRERDLVTGQAVCKFALLMLLWAAYMHLIHQLALNGMIQSLVLIGISVLVSISVSRTDFLDPRI